MDPEDSARLDRHYPQPQLATLHARNFRTEVDCGEQSHGNTLALSRGSLLSGRGAESRSKREPQKPGNDYQSAKENPNTNGFFCSHNSFLLSDFFKDENKKGSRGY
jgi:hypothetical protein